MRLLRHTGVYGLWLHQAKPTSDQGDDLSLFSSLRGGPATRAMDHWCENSLGGSPFSWHRGECDASATSMNLGEYAPLSRVQLPFHFTLSTTFSALGQYSSNLAAGLPKSMITVSPFASSRTVSRSLFPSSTAQSPTLRTESCTQSKPHSPSG